MSFFKKVFDDEFINRRYNSNDNDSDCAYVNAFDMYFSAYLMSGFDKNVQSILFNLYRISDLIESCIDNIPEHIKSEITSDKIVVEVFKQNQFSDKDNELDIEKFENADKDWEVEQERLTDTLIEWGSRFQISNQELNKIGQYILDLRKHKLPEAIANGKRAIDWSEIDTNSKNVINTFYRWQPILFRFCQLNILDILNNTNRYEKIEKDLDKLEIEEIKE